MTLRTETESRTLATRHRSLVQLQRCYDAGLAITIRLDCKLVLSAKGRPVLYSADVASGSNQIDKFRESPGVTTLMHGLGYNERLVQHEQLRTPPPRA